jgi:hypothetical protein
MSTTGTGPESLKLGPPPILRNYLREIVLNVTLPSISWSSKCTFSERLPLRV